MSCSTGDAGFVTLASSARKVLALASAFLAGADYPLQNRTQSWILLLMHPRKSQGMSNVFWKIKLWSPQSTRSPFLLLARGTIPVSRSSCLLGPRHAASSRHGTAPPHLQSSYGFIKKHGRPPKAKRRPLQKSWWITTGYCYKSDIYNSIYPI